MVFATLRQRDCVTVRPVDGKTPIRIHGVRDAGGPAQGQPVELCVSMTEAAAIVQYLQHALKECGVEKRT